MSDSPLIDRRHLDFVLYEVLRVQELCALPRFVDHSRDTFESAIDLAHQIAVDHFLPHNRKGDLNEPRWIDGRVEVIPEVGAALRTYTQAGFMAELADEAEGGMQLPYTVALACDGMFMGANLGTAGYTFLTRAAANLLRAHASEAQQRRYLRPMLAGHWFGTMCLSEPQAGSSLADIQCTATPQADGSYRLSGAKMWISGGDHEISDNIVHLVLARTPDAPPGVKGISLFIVPRWTVNEDGTLKARNDVTLAGINHKLGQRGIVNCFLKFGEDGQCYAERIGLPNQGLAYMFHMMNEARIGVGFCAVQLGWAGYQYSLSYARERIQGRHPGQKEASAKPVPIIEHADVRRLLLLQKAAVEGCHLLALFAATQVDLAAQHPDPGTRSEARLLLEFLTPLVKSVSADLTLRANDAAIQVLGGYGYTREYPVEQFYRDNRLNPIHEGTNGIQAIDLLGRKAMLQSGAALKLFLGKMRAAADEVARVEGLAPLAAQLRQKAESIGQVSRAAAERMAAGETRECLSNAHHYLQLVGYSAIAWMLLWQARVASQCLEQGAVHADFHAGKLQACRYFFAVELPQTDVSARLLLEQDRTVYEMRDSWF